MKKIITAIYFILIAVSGHSQNGLENIIVEKYYITDANDAASDKSGNIHTGAVTYRIYVDMLPGYRFQAAYGVAGHELKIATTTFFYNNEDGATIANDIPNKRLKENTVMLDSWLSVGAAFTAGYGISKVDDDTATIFINANNPPVLQNENPLAGIPLKLRDGILIASPQSAVTTFGIEKEMNVFNYNKVAANGNLFSTSNGSWASFGGAIGPKPDNKVLIAQLTTDGVLSFELNIQLGTPDGGVENYVAKNPVGNEIKLSCLTYLVAETKANSKNTRKTALNAKTKN